MFLDKSDRLRDSLSRRAVCALPFRDAIRRRNAPRLVQCIHHVGTPLVVAAAALPVWIEDTSPLRQLAKEVKGCQSRLAVANPTDDDFRRAADLWDRLPHALLTCLS
jgi:hypothetical protein